MRRYADTVKLYTISYTLLITVAIPGMAIVSCTPCILDIFVPMNDSRPRRLPILVEYYFIDEEVYFYIILTHICVTQYAGCIAVLAILMLLIAFVLHTCALFKIASYRMEHICDENVQVPKNLKQYVFYEKLIHAVHIHRRALDLATIMTNSFAKFYFILLIVGLSLMVLNIINFVNAINLDDTKDLVIFTGIITLQSYYLYVANYVGQNVIDTSTDIHQAVYNTHWYTAPLWIQKSILFVIRKSNKKSVLKTGGLFDASLEGFATLVSMCMSYVMVFLSTQE
ncbi:odorant receptor 9a-like [Anoplolepis gracilipes]|uniref:odorant receptor 9a-like n=1 Tax=Anoplolepis gracilipes TaxID=354296 RepID=UPI003BA16DC1